jgi:hypothetical protein
MSLNISKSSFPHSFPQNQITFPENGRAKKLFYYFFLIPFEEDLSKEYFLYSKFYESYDLKTTVGTYLLFFILLRNFLFPFFLVFLEDNPFLNLLITLILSLGIFFCALL